MKQPEDNRTLELPLNQQRGRGRPPLEHALTPAERAKRYRDKKRLNKSDAAAVTVEYQPDYVGMVLGDRAEELEAKVAELEAKNAALEKRLYEMQMALDVERCKNFEASQKLLNDESADRVKAKRLAESLQDEKRAHKRLKDGYKQLEKDSALIADQAAAYESRASKLEEKLARREKVIKDLRDAQRRNA